MDVGKLLNHVNIVLYVWLFFFGMCFFFFFLTGWEFGVIPYNWHQSLELGLSGSNDRGSRKVVWNKKV